MTQVNIGNYQVKVQKIVPQFKGNELHGRTKCYTGISISNPFFMGKDSHVFFQWILRNFKHCYIFIDDFFHQYNEKAFTGHDVEVCIKSAQIQGKKIEEHIQKVIDSTFDESYRFKIVRSSELSKDNSFKSNSTFFKKQFKEIPQFKAGIETSARNYVDRQLKRGNSFAVSKEEAVSLSCNYLVEEIAVFTTICEKGYDVEVYPGPELPILIDIANGVFPDMPASLLNRINVELKITKK